MSGRWEPYLFSVRDTATLARAYRESKDKAGAVHDRWTAKENGLLAKYKARRTSTAEAASESDMRQIDMLLGTKSTDYRDNPEFLAEARELYCAFFREMTGKEPTPWRPVGPSEMYERNRANMEWCSTALYWAPGPDDDVVMCMAEDLEYKEPWWAEHFRDRKTLEYVASGLRYGHNDSAHEAVQKSPFRVVRFEYDPTKREALRPLIDQERRDRHRKASGRA